MFYEDSMRAVVHNHFETQIQIFQPIVQGNDEGNKALIPVQ